MRSKQNRKQPTLVLPISTEKEHMVLHQREKRISHKKELLSDSPLSRPDWNRDYSLLHYQLHA